MPISGKFRSEVEAGELTHLVTIKRSATTQDSYGHPTINYGSVTSMVTKAWANVMTRQAWEAARLQAVSAQATHMVKIRYITGILPSMRIEYTTSDGMKNLEIMGAYDKTGRELALHIECREDTSAAA